MSITPTLFHKPILFVNNKCKLENKELRYELKRFERLYELVVVSLDKFLAMFRDGEYDQLAEEFTGPVSLNLGLILASGNFTNASLGDISNYIYDKLTFTSYRTLW